MRTIFERGMDERTAYDEPQEPPFLPGGIERKNNGSNGKAYNDFRKANMAQKTVAAVPFLACAFWRQGKRQKPAPVCLNDMFIGFGYG